MSDPIVIVGCGNIGSRLLQSVSNTEGARTIVALEPFRQAWDTAQERFNEMNAGGHSLVLTDRPSGLPDKAELVIFAMDARNRLAAMKDVLPVCQTSKVLLEKVLFTHWEDYAQAEQMLSGKSCWVNTSRNVWPGYHAVKKEMNGAELLEFAISGSDWSMGSNAIHFLSIAEFLAGSPVRSLTIDPDTADIRESKRGGYKDVTGVLTGSLENGAKVNIASLDSEGEAINVTLRTSGGDFTIHEGQNLFFRNNSPDNKQAFEFCYTSQLKPMFDEILNKGTSPLPEFGASMALHKKMIEAMNAIFYGEPSLDKECPIT